MKKNINLIFLTLLIIFTNTNKVYATHYPWVYGDAAVFKIIMRKLELCTGFQGGHSFNIREKAFCNDALVIGEGDQEIDITSVEAGLAVAAYGKSALIPFGETYTHVRLTIDKKFVMKNFLDANGKGLDTGSSDTSNCNTKKITDDMYGNSLDDNEWQRTNNYKWTEARNKYGTMVSYPEDENGIPEETNVYMIDGTDDSFVRWQGEGVETWEDHHWTHYHCYGLFCKSWGYWDRQYGNDGLNKNSLLAGSAVAMSIPRSGDLPAGGTPSTNNNFKNELSQDSTDDLIFVIPLKKRYTVKTNPPPVIDIAFNTKEGIMVFESYNGENTGQCPESAKVNGVCEIPNQKGMCTFRLGKVLVEIEMKDANVPPPKRTRGDFR
jgi:hypothetical protein